MVQGTSSVAILIINSNIYLLGNGIGAVNIKMITLNIIISKFHIF